MKHLKTFENGNSQDNIIKLEKDLYNILENEIINAYLKSDDNELNDISHTTKTLAIREIVKYLIKIGIDFDLYFDSKKFNL